MSDRTISLRSALTISPQRARYLWKGRIPLQAVTVTAGAPGLGKTTLNTELAALATLGKLSGDLEGTPTSVIYASAEDSAETTLLPRFMAAGGDPSRLYFVEVAVDEDGDPGALTLPDDTAELARLAVLADARLLVLDPVMAYLPEHVNAHRDQHVRRVLAPLARMAQELDIAVTAVMHLNKGESQDALSRIGGSVGFTAAARSVLIFGRDPDDPEGENGSRRVLAHAKCNVGPLAPSIRAQVDSCTIEGPRREVIPTSRLTLGGTVEQTARDLLGGGNVGGEEASARGEARDLLAEELGSGPRPVNELREQADAAGISWRTVERAKKQLGVRARKNGSGWAWELPEKADTPKNPLVGLDGLDGLDGVKTDKTAKADNPAKRNRNTAAPARSMEAMDVLDSAPSGLPATPPDAETCDGCGAVLTAFGTRLICVGCASNGMS